MGDNDIDPPRRICSADTNDVVAMAALLYLDMSNDDVLIPPEMEEISPEMTSAQRFESILELVDSAMSLMHQRQNEVFGGASTTSFRRQDTPPSGEE